MNVYKICIAAVLMSVTLGMRDALSEEFTLTTYYPSPRGVYNELRTLGDVHVGSTSKPEARLHILQDDFADAFRVDDEMNLFGLDETPFVINEEGNVGIGTPNPQTKFQVGQKGYGNLFIYPFLEGITNNAIISTFNDLYLVADANSSGDAGDIIFARGSNTEPSLLTEAMRIEYEDM